METVEATTAPLNTLGYDVAWLEYGFLDIATLNKQIAAFQSGEDLNTEHYRYATFRQALAERSAMDAETVSRYLHLAEIDSDLSMAQAALGDLLQWDRLTESQWETLSQHSLFAAPFLQKLVSRRRLLRALDADSVTEEIFAACLAFRDAPVQRSLVSHKAITATQLQVLAERGVNLAVRNLAQARQRQKNR